ncbi:hypothetical protein RAH32_19885, partial [Paracoccus sp. WLY502]|uniref:hypothetical protein n=1 Tax=Paracoccus yibinensis TaxID=3068891 RepID=UPI0027968053
YPFRYPAMSKSNRNKINRTANPLAINQPPYSLIVLEAPGLLGCVENVYVGHPSFGCKRKNRLSDDFLLAGVSMPPEQDPLGNAAAERRAKTTSRIMRFAWNSP